MHTIPGCEPNEILTDRSADGAIERIEDDLLDREHFARHLATMIARRKGKQSFVVSLQGPWGCGKSSIKNMAIAAIRKMPEVERPLIVEFNPWQFRGNEALLHSFFDDIATILGKDLPATAQKLKSYAGKLAFGSKVLSAVGGAVTLTTGVPINALLPVVDLLRNSGSLIDQASDHVERSDFEETSIATAKTQLAKELRKLSVPVLVIIDDIDRLYAEETALIFQLVKANADFPNFTYLMLYDREVVAKSLDHAVAGRGEQYLEKIVQHPITVPIPNHTQVCEVWLNQLKRVYEDLNIVTEQNVKMWSSLRAVFDKGLSAYIKNLRDVWRTVNAIELSAPLLVTEGHLDVNFVDFVVLETFRVLESKLYELLPVHKQALLGLPNSWEQAQKYIRDSEQRYGVSIDKQGDDKAPPSSREELDNLLHSVTGGNPRRYESLVIVMKGLFPKAHWKKVTGSAGLDSISGWTKHDSSLAVGEATYFDRYFGLRLTCDELLEKQVHALSNSEDVEWIRGKLIAYRDSQRLDEVVGRVLMAVKERQGTCSRPFLVALLEVGDWAYYCRYNNPFYHLVSILLKLCLSQDFDSIEKRADELNRILKSSDAIIYPISLFNDGVGVLYDGYWRDGTLPQFNACADTVLAKIQQRAKENRLHLHPAVDQIIQFWRQRQEEATDSWLREIRKRPEILKPVLEAWSYYWFDGGSVWNDRATEMTQYLPVDVIQAALEFVDNEKVDSKQNEYDEINQLYRKYFPPLQTLGRDEAGEAETLS